MRTISKSPRQLQRRRTAFSALALAVSLMSVGCKPGTAQAVSLTWKNREDDRREKYGGEPLAVLPRRLTISARRRILSAA